MNYLVTRRRGGFTLLELALVSAILAMLLVLLWPVVTAARSAARRTTCAGNLHQIDIAYQLYAADYGVYPGPTQVVASPALRSEGVRFCPEDRSAHLIAASSSYAYADRVPPDFHPLGQTPAVHPSVVLTFCDAHIRLEETPATVSASRNLSGYYQVLRAAGAVQRVPANQVRQYHPDGDPYSFIRAFPGEPGYEQAQR